jgi:hypothetical protein
MALGLSTGGTGGGEIQPYVNYDAKAGRMFRVDRSQDGSGAWLTDKVEITNTVQMVMDLANIKVGWINYTAQGPVRKLVVIGKEPIPPRPDDKNAEGKFAFKQGFEVQLLLDKASGGGAPRVFGSAAMSVIEAMDALHDTYSGAAESKAGKLPIVKIARVQPIKAGQSTNYKPEFAIVGWVDRPAALVEPVVAAAPAAVAPSTGSTVVSAPVAAPIEAVISPPVEAGNFG